MSDRFDRSRRRPPGTARGGRPRPRNRPSFDDEPEEESFDEFDDEAEEAAAPPPRRPAARRGGRPAPGRRPAARARSSWSLFGSRRPAPTRGRPGRGLDWEAAEEEEYGDEYESDAAGFADDELAEEAAPRRRAPARRGGSKGRRVTLMDLCTPVFGLAAILPRDPGGIHPGYEQVRQEALAALQKLDSQTASHGIEREDAAEARYALALFIDEQVAGSEWAGRAQWASEPLNMVLINDPEGGINFFTHLERLGERQREVKKIYLVCLALGFRGQYATLDPAQQAAQIGDIRQKLVRSIQGSLDSQEVLFPEGYEQATPLEGKAPPPPAWWLIASLGSIAAVVLLWLALFFFAGRKPDAAEAELRRVIDRTGATAEASTTPPAAPAAAREDS